MRPLRALWVACLTFLLAASAGAQVPAVPVVPAVPAAPPVGFFASLGMACKAKKQRCCQSPLGQMLATLARPMHTMTGGLLPSCCPPGPTPADLAAPGPVGAAAKIKAEEAQAKARREAVKFLATVDCHYYPEAEATLIGALRCDRNECVRWEAAHALSNGCCCNKRTIEALTIAATGSERDGNPAETSFRVRVEAINALQFCVSHHQDAPVRPELPSPPEQPVASQSAGEAARETVQLASYYVELSDRPMTEFLLEAHRVLEAHRKPATSGHLPPTGERNLLTMWRNAGVGPKDHATDTSQPTLALSAKQQQDKSPEQLVVQPLPPVPPPSEARLTPPLPRPRS